MESQEEGRRSRPHVWEGPTGTSTRIHATAEAVGGMPRRLCREPGMMRDGPNPGTCTSADDTQCRLSPSIQLRIPALRE